MFVQPDIGLSSTFENAGLPSNLLHLYLFPFLINAGYVYQNVFRLERDVLEETAPGL